MVLGEHCGRCRRYRTFDVFSGAFGPSCWGLEQWAVGARARGVHRLRVHFQRPGVARSFKRLPLCTSSYRLSQCPRDHISQSRPPETLGILSGGKSRLCVSLSGPSLCPCPHSPETPSCERLTPVAMLSHMSHTDVGGSRNAWSLRP
uniref:Uncharacterized protein n=1 Tax=Rangifer tarandus platyrhynchus TaxID=3082113 RepID=A0ACB0EGF8_RANTA|nr:unnamed protein product [Rangifer tarandus platyrhynchus]